jgi:hypothetical protein
MQFTEAKLFAYAGNELDPLDTGVLEDMMAAEPELARRAVAALLQRRLGRAAAGSVVPRPMKPASRAVPGGRSRVFRDFATTGPASMWPVTAGIAVLALVGLGYVVVQSAGSDTGSVGLGQIQSAGLQSALEGIPTGGSDDLRGGKFRAIASFVAGDGSLCREFSLTGRSGRGDAVACRHSLGWTVTFAVLEPPGGADYLPADGDDTMSTYLRSVGSGKPLTGPAEIQLLGEKP